jgi:excinuclease UvrABC nuclease subunit
MRKVKWLNWEFEVAEHGANWAQIGGIYIFAGVNAQNQWVALYIGQTDNFRNRIPQHDQWSQAVRLGASHVHAMVEQREDVREAIEKALIGTYQPALNVQHK